MSCRVTRLSLALALVLHACDTIGHVVPFDAPPDVVDAAPDATPDAPPEPLPLGAIVPFDDVCPAGFTERIDLANQYLRGHDGDATFGETGGAATHVHQIAAHLHTLAQAGTAHTHTLTFAPTTSGQTTATGGSLSGSLMPHVHVVTASLAGGPHTHAVDTAAALTSGPAPNLPPYREVVLCEVTGAVTLVPATARMLAETACAPGWAALEDIADRLLRGHDLDGNLAEVGGGGHVHAFAHDHGTMTGNGGDHTHTATSGTSATTIAGLLAGSTSAAQSNHTHQITITNLHAHTLAPFAGDTAATVALPEYREILACRSTTGPAPLPANALVLAIGPCPVGWQEVITYRNRFLGGDDGNATPGEVAGGPHTHDAGHTHGMTGITSHQGTYATNVTSPMISLATGTGANVASGAHSHPLTISVADAHAHATVLAAPAVQAEDALPLYTEVVVCTRP